MVPTAAIIRPATFVAPTKTPQPPFWFAAPPLATRAAAPARSVEAVNGLSANGTNPNRLSANGINPNGSNPNGANPNGLNPNRLSANGISVNGANPNGFTGSER